MSLAIQLLRIMLFSFFAFLAANGVGVWDAGAETLTLQVDWVTTLIIGVGGHLATPGWWCGLHTLVSGWRPFDVRNVSFIASAHFPTTNEGNACSPRQLPAATRFGRTDTISAHFKAGPLLLLCTNPVQ